MTTAANGLADGFILRLLSGVAVDLKIAIAALSIGLLVGGPLAFAPLAGRPLRLTAGTIVQLLRAAPTFVVMFFLYNILPRNAHFLDIQIRFSPELIVALSLSAYSVSYVADSGADALAQWRSGSPLGALLFLPNVARAFLVLVMAAGAGVAIGVPEGIAVILQTADVLPSLADRLWLFAIGVLVFGTILQSGFLVVLLARGYLTRMLQRHADTSIPTEKGERQCRVDGQQPLGAEHEPRDR